VRRSRKHLDRKSKERGSTQIESVLDDVDVHVVAELTADGRLSFGELGRRVGLTAPAVAERVHRLEGAGIISGYHAKIDRSKFIAAPITTFIALQCRRGRCLRNDGGRAVVPEVVEGYRVSGDRCSLLKVEVDSVQHLQDVIGRLNEYGETSTTLVLNARWEPDVR